MTRERILDLDELLARAAGLPGQPARPSELARLQDSALSWTLWAEGLVHELARTGQEGTGVYQALDQFSDALFDLLRLLSSPA